MKKAMMLLLGAICTVWATEAAVVSQSLTLVRGWNAVYVSVTPEASADELFAAWPVESVSAYNADAFLRTSSTSGGLTGEPVVRAPYLIWSRESPEGSTLKHVVADSILLCCVTNASGYSAMLSGTPAAPRIAWHASVEGDDSTLNIIGVQLSGDVNANDYFAGSPLTNNATFYKIGGESNALFTVYGGGFKQKTAPTLSDGSVVFVRSPKISDWSGPLYIAPKHGIDFGADSSEDVFEIRNDSTTSKWVTVTYAADVADGISAGALFYRTPDDAAWKLFSDELSSLEDFKLDPGEKKQVAIALDRTKLANTGKALGGVLTIEESGTKMLVYLPVGAKDVKGDSPWPQGLWVANIKLTKVSYYKGDSNRVDGVAAGGTMNIRAYIGVDSNKVARLYQRVRVGGARLSSAFLPVDMGAVAGSGNFGAHGSPLRFDYTIGAKSPSNPFRHALHPLFDGKTMDFKTAAPDGDDINNYAGSVKPEWFSIGGEVDFAFDENAATSWSPEETLKGDAKWIYTGVRRDGPVIAEGRFTMRRIATAWEEE